LPEVANPVDFSDLLTDVLANRAATPDNSGEWIGDEPTKGVIHQIPHLTRRSLMALEKEMETYNSRRDELLQHEGKFVVIQGDQIAGFWDTYEDALKAAYDRFKLEGFMIKQIFAVEPIHYLARGTPICPS
jgi:hypothetical protein